MVNGADDEWQGDSGDNDADIKTGNHRVGTKTNIVASFLHSLSLFVERRHQAGMAEYNGVILSTKVNKNAATERIVTVSDEAFALLLFENDIESGSKSRI